MSISGSVWINAEAMLASQDGKTAEQIGRDALDAMKSFQEGRYSDLPAWMAVSVDNGQQPGGSDES